MRKTWDAFVEYAGDFPEQGGPRHLVHFGTASKPIPHLQLDLHVGLGYSSAAVDHFIGVGYSFRLQAVLPSEPCGTPEVNKLSLSFRTRDAIVSTGTSGLSLF